jgi:hypothetical protein
LVISYWLLVIGYIAFSEVMRYTFDFKE